MSNNDTFSLPDTIVSLPTTGFAFSPGTDVEAAEILAGTPHQLFTRLLSDQESQAAQLVAVRLVTGFLSQAPTTAPDDTADAIADRVAAVRDSLAERLAGLVGEGVRADVRAEVLRQRAPLAMLHGCWLDTVSQPATQPSLVVNGLFRHHFRLKGEGNPRRAVEYLRRRALENEGIYLPELVAADFLGKAGARPLTSLHAAFCVAVSRLPGQLLPELVGLHYVRQALGVDDLLYGTEPLLPAADVHELLRDYLALVDQSPDPAAVRHRLDAAIGLALAMESEHVAMLVELADWRGGLSLDARAAEILRRHAPYAGGQHRRVRVAGTLLTESLSDPELDFTAFMTEFRASGYLRKLPDGGSVFGRALKFGGPMFGIFDEAEAAVLNAWVAAVQAGEPAAVVLPENRVGDGAAERWRAAVDGHRPDGMRFAEPYADDDRELLHQLVHADSFPLVRPLARERAEQGLTDGELLWTHGAGGRYTDASWFDYTPEALLERVERIYWDKLVNPYRPLKEIPSRDEVIFNQKTFTLANLIDGTWACRIGNLGRFGRRSDGMLFSIYADEMGRGDVAKNHVTIIHQVLDSMQIRLPHLRDEAFRDQGELPDSLYGFSIHQLCLSLFPDSYYNELLGYNLAIEMFGLGELRMHEMEKLRRYGFDTAYEETHLSIDNFSAGHARESAEIIVAYLDDVRRSVGPETVRQEWRRIWRGYASFAYFVEHELVKDVTGADVPQQRTPVRESDLVI